MMSIAHDWRPWARLVNAKLEAWMLLSRIFDLIWFVRWMSTSLCLLLACRSCLFWGICSRLSKLCFFHSWHSSLLSSWIAKGATASVQSLRPACLCQTPSFRNFLSQRSWSPFVSECKVFNAWSNVWKSGELRKLWIFQVTVNVASFSSQLQLSRKVASAYLSSPCFSTSLGGIGGPAHGIHGILAVMYWISIIRGGPPPPKMVMGLIPTGDAVTGPHIRGTLSMREMSL